MRKPKINTNNISQEQGNRLKGAIGALIDIWVVLTDGKPIGGKK